MLIKLSYLSEKYNINIKGVLHVGAHLAEEYDDYLALGIVDVVWIEANPDLYERLCEKIKNQKGNKAISALISDEDNVEMKFNVTKNEQDGTAQSSSVLEFGSHEASYPHVKMEESKILKSKRLDSLFNEYALDPKKYNFINIDLQGYELPALKSYGENLRRVDYIYSEINIAEVYKDCTKVNELDKYLSDYGFERAETKMTKADWGDALYVKK